MSKQATAYWKVATNKEEQFAELFLYGYIGQLSSWDGHKLDDTGLTDIEVVQKMRELEETYPLIKIRINSPGGSVFHGDPIVNAIRSSKAEIHTYADGVVASMAADIWAAGHVRHMSLNSKLMIHSISTPAFGNAIELMAAAELVDKMDQVAIMAFAADTGMSETEVREKFYDYQDHWLTPAEVLEMGLISEIEDYKVTNVAHEPEKMAMSDLVKMYSPTAEKKTTRGLGERLSELVNKITNRAEPQAPAPDISNNQTSTKMKTEDFQKSLADGELPTDAVVAALKAQGYEVSKPEPPAAPEVITAEVMQKAIADALATQAAENKLGMDALKAEITKLGDAPGAQPTGAEADGDGPSGVNTGGDAAPDHIKVLADAANNGERVAKF